MLLCVIPDLFGVRTYLFKAEPALSVVATLYCYWSYSKNVADSRNSDYVCACSNTLEAFSMYSSRKKGETSETMYSTFG